VKKITLIIFFIFINILAFNTTSYAEEIGDFQIEGFALGESLQDYYNEEDIFKIKRDNFVQIHKIKGDEYIEILFENEKDISLDSFERLSLLLDNDNIIYAISSDSEIKIKQCIKIKDEIQKDIEKIFWRAKTVFDDWNKNKYGQYYFLAMEFDDGYAGVSCYKKGWLQMVVAFKNIL
jgi:hypothetical protein